MKRYIHIKKEDREFIMKAFGVGERSVFNAVKFDEQRGDTALAHKIRKIALERGGIMMIQAPEVETFHDSDEYMRQYLPNDTLLEFSKLDGGCDVFHRGEKVRHYKCVCIDDIPAIQAYARAL